MGTLKATREELYAAIERERAYQKQKWPEANLTDKPLDVYGRMIVAHEELKEARLAWCKSASNDNALRELLQCVTVGVAYHESKEPNWKEQVIEPYATGFLAWDYSLPQWLEALESVFIQSREYLSDSPNRWPNPALVASIGFSQITAMGMAALLQHGIVEREEFSQQEAEAKKEGMRMFPEAKAYLDILESCNVLNPSARVLSPDRTLQGLFFMRFKDNYNDECSLQKSALLTESAICLGVDEHRMILTQQDVLALLPFLIRFAETGELDAL